MVYDSNKPSAKAREILDGTRKPKLGERRRELREAFMGAITTEELVDLVRDTYTDARGGCTESRKMIFRYLLGEKIEVELGGTDPIEFHFVNLPSAYANRTANAVPGTSEDPE